MPRSFPLEDFIYLPSKPYAEPALIMQKPALAPYSAPARAGVMLLGLDTIGEQYAPVSPIRHDTHDTRAFEPIRGPSLSGQAPTTGIYTGVGGYE